MLSNRRVLAVAPFLAMLAAQACFGSSDNSPANDGGLPGDDSGGPDATMLPGDDAGTPGTDGGAGHDAGAPGSDTGAGGDTGAGDDGGSQGASDAGSPDGNPCGDAVRIDLGTGTVAANYIGAAQSLGRHVAVWPDDYRQTDASTTHLRARVFDGDAGTIDLGPAYSSNNAGVGLAVDGTGEGFLAWLDAYAAATYSTGRFDFSTVTPMMSIPTGLPSAISLAALPVGALSVHQASNGVSYAISYASEKGIADAGPDADWVDAGLTTSTGSAMAAATIHTNAAGQAVVAWADVGPPFTLYAVAYDGTSWGSVATLTIAQGDGGLAQVPNVFAFAVHPNGDASFFLYSSSQVEARTFVASTGQFQAPTAIASPGPNGIVIWTPSYNTERWAVIDSSDRATVVFPMYGDAGVGGSQLYASRNLGSGWTAPEPLGATAGADYQVVLDPASGKVVVGADEWLRSIPAAGTTWSSLGALPDTPNRNGAITFDGQTTVSVHAAPTDAFSGLLGVYAVRCAL